MARTAARAALGLAAVGVALHLLHNGLKVGVPRFDGLVSKPIHLGILVLATLACFLRAVSNEREATAWFLIGSGMTSWTVGEILWKLHFSQLAEPPFPSICDVFWLGFYPLIYAGLVLLVRERVTVLHRSLWIDGLIGALGAASAGAAVAFQPILDATSGSFGTVATNLSYPLADLLLLGLVIGVCALTAWRPGRAWLLLGAGLVAFAIADTGFLYGTATGTWVDGSSFADAMWPAGLLLVGAAAWRPAQHTREVSLEGLRVLLIPGAFCALAFGVLILNEVRPIATLAFALAIATLVAAAVRGGLTLLEHQRMLTRSRHEALADALTGLGNRRRLAQDLDAALASADGAAPHALVLFDLDGFKRYNDSFGHPAGDQLLVRLGASLAAAMEPYGAAYRMGGDEFCALVRPHAAKLDSIVAAAEAALTERGEGFHIGASLGVVRLPVEAATATDALALADRRLYADKDSQRQSASRQTVDALLQVLSERHPDLREHLSGVGEHAGHVARRLGLSTEAVDEVVRAAELHDVGKVAIPDAILLKPGALDEREWEFIRRHTLIGERVLGAAPALVPVGRVVRSSHERWDGRGYPDGLVAEEIPMGARIIAVCDAYDAMTSDRPYRKALGREDALDELQKCGGTQFDPTVVRAFRAVLEEDRRPPVAAVL